MMLFSKALFLATTFPEKIIFSIEFSSDMFRNLHPIVFRPNARKCNAELFNFFENYAKLVQFLQFFRNFFQIFENSPSSGGSATWTPTMPTIILNPRKFPAYATAREK